MTETAIDEDRRDSETANVNQCGQWWLVWVSGAQQWVLGSSKAANAASLAIFDLITFCSLSQTVKFTLRPRLIAHR